MNSGVVERACFESRDTVMALVTRDISKVLGALCQGMKTMDIFPILSHNSTMLSASSVPGNAVPRPDLSSLINPPKAVLQMFPFCK